MVNAVQCRPAVGIKPVVGFAVTGPYLRDT